MKCKETNILLYWSGELSPKKQLEMENHLKTCDRCRKMLADLEALEQEFKALPLVKPDRDLLKVALEKNRKSEKQRWWIPVPAVRFAAAMAAVLVLVFLYVLMNRPDQSSTTHVQTDVPVVSYSDTDLSHQLVNLREKVDRLKVDVRDSRHKSTYFARTTKIDRTFSLIRSDVDELKTRITESEDFPFQDTFIQRRKHYEDDTFYQRRYDNTYSLSLSDFDVC
jgi:hypothetical protein